MPGAITSDITDRIAAIHRLREQVSRWGTDLSGVKTGKAWEELLLHFTGLGHLEVFKLAQYSKYDVNSAKSEFERAVIALNKKLVENHAAHQRLILNEDTLEKQRSGVSSYAKANRQAVDQFSRTWHVKTLPTDVQKAYDTVAALA